MIDFTVYVVTAYRHGDRELHSYVCGVFSDLEKAKQASDNEKAQRSGKYECEILKVNVDYEREAVGRFSKAIKIAQHLPMIKTKR